MRLWLLAFALAACTDNADELKENQGVCAPLDESGCLADSRCQQAFVVAGLQPGPEPLRCLLVETGPASTAACDTLDHDTCRTRADCSPFYNQQLGPTDAAVGDPTYEGCHPEALE